MRFFSLLLFIALAHPVISQDSVSNKRLKPLIITSTIAYSSVMVVLSQTWYDEDRSSFHFFNDNAEWKQIDKIGHVFSAFHLSAVSYEGLRWGGLNEKKAALWGTAAGMLMVLPVELLDGFSPKYGASSGDIIADIAGSALFLGQRLYWKEARITPKLSFHRTSYAPQRPNVLGNGLSEEWLKDYNGQTYWLSFDTDKFINKESRVLDYINVAVGYGAEGMIYARDNQNIEAGYEPYRQYYLSLDFDLTAIRTNKKWLKSIFYVVNTIHLPSPTLSFAEGNFKFHPLYF